MKKVLAAAVLAVAAVAIIKKVRKSKNKKGDDSPFVRQLHTGAREEAYFARSKKGESKNPQFA